MPKSISVFSIVALLLAFSVSCAQNGSFDPERDVVVEILPSVSGFEVGTSADIAVVFHVPQNYHINSLETGLFYVLFDEIDGLTFSDPRFPPGKDWEGDTVYDGDVTVLTAVTVSSDAEPGDVTITAKAGYQVCVETGTQQCYFPVEKELTFATEILSAGTEAKPLNAELFGATDESETQVKSEVIEGDKDLATSVQEALERGSFLALFLVFLGGILTSFTPCVYPIIPITVSYIGARAEGQKLRGFILSLFFVLGLAVMYSSLGVIAALTGGVFGGLTQHPVVYGIMVAIFLIMGASMMGAFDITLPASFQGKLQSGQRKGVWGAILMGMGAGLIAAPCVGPVLVALLSWVAQTGSVLIGFGLLFTFSLGMGMLFIVIGTFAGAMTALPSAGGWMDGVKHFFGWLLWGTAVYFAGNLLPDSVMPLVWGAFLSLLGIYIGAFRPAPEEQTWNWVLRKWFGILAVVTGLLLFVIGFSTLAGWQLPSGAATSTETIQSEPDWMVNDIEGAFAKAKADNKPVMMDFYADWCVACVELDRKTYNQQEIIDRSKKFVCLKMDFTTQDDWSKKISTEYQIKGMPTVIFFKPDGTEVERFVGFKGAAGVGKMMDRTLSVSK